MTQPKIIEVKQEQINELLEAIKAGPFPQQQRELLTHILTTFNAVMQALQKSKTTIASFRKMLFGNPTESRSNLLKKAGNDAGNGLGEGGSAPKSAPNAPVSAQEPPGVGEEKKKRKGHGRNGSDAYSGAQVVVCNHSTLKPGDLCPECLVGKLYRAEPITFVKITGQSPLGGTAFRQEKWRCRLCDTVIIAPLPDGVDSRKYDESCAAMIALLRYGSGMPFYRLEALQAGMQVPLPDSTQWDIVSKAAEGPRNAFAELIRQAAQAEVLHNDDTPARILDLMGSRRAKADAKAVAAGEEQQQAKGIYTSGIVALLPTKERVMLFFTGAAHAGQNLALVLAHRANELPVPTQMCDALTANVTGAFKTILANCLSHGRRKFVEVIESFPAQCTRVINDLANVYNYDAHCKTEKMSDEQRLVHHQNESGPIMVALKKWMQEQFDERLAEPNSGLGQALKYMLKHWEKLTLFLRKAGAPLDNNICERALKKAIIHRKNSLFYRSLRGAEVGDIYMSLIYTCQECKANAFDYLKALQKHADAVAANPSQWLPWNYRAAMPDTS
jgi:transposase